MVLLFHNEKVVGLNLPDNITLKVLETEGVVKGQTAASSYKPAELENNIKTSVPQFISIGDRVVISIQDGSYLESQRLMQPAIINIFEKAAKKAGKIIIEILEKLTCKLIQNQLRLATNTDVQVEKSYRNSKILLSRIFFFYRRE